MNAEEFEKYGIEAVKYIARYKRDLGQRHVTSRVEPGYLRALLPKHAPVKGESFSDIMKDVEKFIMPGVSMCIIISHIYWSSKVLSHFSFLKILFS